MTTYQTRTVRDFDEPESDWTAPENKLLYSGDDLDAAMSAKRGFDRECDPCEGAVVIRLSDGAKLVGDCADWQLAA